MTVQQETNLRTVLAATGHEVLFTHSALWGAAAIAATTGADVRLGWTGGLSPAPVVHGIVADALAAAVQQHALRSLQPDHWIQAGQPHDPTRALFSPRIKVLPHPAAWSAMQAARENHLDQLTARGATLDLRLLAALGEPSWWHQYRGSPRQDDAASRLEMQPRNQGSEFVGTLLRKLAIAVGERAVAQVSAGLTGATRTDEAGKNKPDSRSAGNLRPPAVTDNALAWVAMWGLAAAPVAHQVNTPSRTATCLTPLSNRRTGGERATEHVVVPLWAGRWTVGRLHAVLSSRAMTDVARAALPDGIVSAETQRDQEWLLEHGVRALVLLPVGTFGSTNAPERRVLPGRLLRLGTRQR